MDNTKVKILKGTTPEELEANINRFLDDKQPATIVDIKLSQLDTYLVALIIYKIF